MRRTDSGCGRTARRKHSGGGTGSSPLEDQVEQLYRRSILSCKTQSLVMLGRSGSGKSCNFKQSLGYLLETTQKPEQSRFTIEKMHAVDCLLESFCSTRTSLNTHASRLVLITELEFNLDGGLEGGGLEIALPDTSRLLRTGRMAGEPTFPILYQIQAALGKSNLFLPPRTLNKNAFFTPLQDEMEILTALEDWGRVGEAMDQLKFSSEEQDSFWIILAAITNLGYVAKCLESGESVDPSSLEKISNLLGVKPEDLRLVFSRANTPRTISPASSMTLSSSSSRNPSPSPSSSSLGLRAACSVLPDCSTLAVDNVRRLAVNLYSDLLSRLVTYINRSLKPSSRQPCNIFLFDSPGFQNPSTSGDKPSAGFVDLCYNYLQEKVQNMFNTEKIETITKTKGAGKMLFSNRGNPEQILNLLERQEQEIRSKSTSTLGRRGSKRVRFQNSAPGLFTLLHRAGNCPWSDDEVFLHRLSGHWGHLCKGNLLERVGEDQFILRHSLGTNPVKYSVRGWRHVSYSMGRTNLALELLRKSTRKELCVDNPALLYPGAGFGQTPLSFSEVRARMSCLQIQVQVDAMIQLLAKTEISFVFCFLPHNLAGLCELFKRSPGRHSNQKLLRDQIRGFQILDYLNALQSQGHSPPAFTLLPEQVESCIYRVEEMNTRPGLAGELWQCIQLAVFNAVTNLDSIERAISSITRTVSLPSHPLTQVVDETGLLLLQNGKLNLNLQSLLDYT
ncbi:unconventional myosin-XVIIIa [Eurytemora carolleeae]|uniref:unconventional myosin-XVIIIa n=1 Tax=Eurytemora carolleeae TaxID=1294199 RepID=UPI000C7829D3|nr:unconventional myosin-XVIIIa [Eurytemora carolleeae]|eukprot:XP_023320885.1 unconventional myosin-XVIIIa-like [Eurytemora affinis]